MSVSRFRFFGRLKKNYSYNLIYKSSDWRVRTLSPRSVPRMSVHHLFPPILLQNYCFILPELCKMCKKVNKNDTLSYSTGKILACRENFLWEFLAADIERVKSIGTIGAMLQKILLSLSQLFAGLILAEAVASS